MSSRYIASKPPDTMIRSAVGRDTFGEGVLAVPAAAAEPGPRLRLSQGRIEGLAEDRAVDDLIGDVDQTDGLSGDPAGIQGGVGGKLKRVGSISVKVREGQDMKAVEESIKELLRQRLKAQPGAEDPFAIRNLTEILQAQEASSRVMTLLLAAVAGISLVIGGIGIMNIMLVSVTERTREIGLRMAVGARGRDILTQFLIEAVTLSLIGGAIGVAVGALTTWAVGFFAGWQVSITPGAIVACDAQGTIQGLCGSHLALAQGHRHGFGEVVVVLHLGLTATPSANQVGRKFLTDGPSDLCECAWLQIGPARRHARQGQHLMQQRIRHKGG